MNRQTCLMAALLLFSSVPAAFAQHNNDLDAYRDAGAKFASLVADAEKSTGEKRLQSEEANRLVTILSDEKRFLKAERYSASEMGGLLEVCGISNQAVMSLALFSLKQHIDPKAEPQVIAGQLAALMQRNSQSFGYHLRYLQPFSIRCAAKQMQPMAEFAASLTPEQFTDVRREGLQKVRIGIAQMFVGVIRNLADQGADEAYRLALVQTLADTAPALVSALPVPLRSEIRSIALPLKESSPPRFRAYLDKIYAALDNDVCQGLCSI